HNNNNNNNINDELNESGSIIEINKIENNSDNEEVSLTSNNTSNSFFQKIRNNISSSFRKYTDKNEEEEDEESRINYSYYLGDNEEDGSNIESTHPNTITITTSNINNSDSNEAQITQLPLYSVNTTPTWFIRANDPYSLESHIINHMRSNSRYDALLEQIQQRHQHDGDQNQFTPYSNHFANEIQQIRDQQNNLIKDNDIIVIEQPNNKISIGFSESKFTHYHKSGEHNPSGYFSPNDEIIQRLSSQYREFGISSPNGIRDDVSDNFSDYGVRLSFFELEKRKKLFLSVLSVEMFYYCLLLTSFTSFHPLIVFLLVGLANNILALISIKRQNVIAFSIFLCIEILMIAFNYFTDLTALFILRVILFMIAYKLRQEMIIFQSYPNSQQYTI
ncbi:hypothetical protein DICPUDRAFT_27061, partial [Dictyostelium purpureum]